MNPQKLLWHRRELRRVLRQQSAPPILWPLVDDAVGGVGAGEADVTGVAWGGEHTGGELGVKFRRGA